MLQEIDAAVTFLTKLVAKSVDSGGSASPVASTTPPASSSSTTSTPSSNPNHNSTNISEEKIKEFSRKLSVILQNRFRNHWYPDKPTKGQGYRCIRINANCKVDDNIEQACNECGLSYDLLRLPVELTLWIDPNEVTCRFGEHKGSYCVVAKLRDGRQENYVDQINIDELEKRSLERSKQSTFDITNPRKKRPVYMARSKNSPMSMYGSVNCNNNSAYHGLHQMNGSLGNGGSPNLSTTASGHSSHISTTTTNLNGYVEYQQNGILTSTSSNMSLNFHTQYSAQSAAHFYNSSPFQTQMNLPAGAVQHTTHYSSPSHLFPAKYNHMGLTQQGPSGQPAGSPLQTNRALNAGSLTSSDYNQSILMEKERRHTNNMTATAASASAATIVPNRF